MPAEQLASWDQTLSTRRRVWWRWERTRLRGPARERSGRVSSCFGRLQTPSFLLLLLRRQSEKEGEGERVESMSAGSLYNKRVNSYDSSSQAIKYRANELIRQSLVSICRGPSQPLFLLSRSSFTDRGNAARREWMLIQLWKRTVYVCVCVCVCACLWVRVCVCVLTRCLHAFMLDYECLRACVGACVQAPITLCSFCWWSAVIPINSRRGLKWWGRWGCTEHKVKEGGGGQTVRHGGEGELGGQLGDSQSWEIRYLD